jgi:hypothetical protein
VLRIEKLSFPAAGISTGFLLSPTLVAAADHVIDQSVLVSLIAETQRTTGTVIGADAAHDLRWCKPEDRWSAIASASP